LSSYARRSTASDSAATTFLQSLSPGPTLEERLRSFRFANEPPVTVEPEYESLAEQAIDLIQQGLSKN
jgi:hypothetical protein